MNMLNQPPPSYAGSLHSSNNDVELPEYSESSLYANYRKDMKRSPSRSNAESENSEFDVERQDGKGEAPPAPEPAALAPREQKHERKARNQDRRPHHERRGRQQEVGRNCRQRGNCLRCLKPTEVRRALDPIPEQRRRAARSPKSLIWEWTVIMVMVLLYLLYAALVLGIPILMICSWAGVDISSWDDDKNDS